LISNLKDLFFFASYRFLCFLNSKEFVQDRVTKYVSDSVLRDISYLVGNLEDLSIDEAVIIKTLLCEQYLYNFTYLEEEKKEIIKKVSKKINHKIKWIVKTKERK